MSFLQGTIATCLPSALDGLLRGLWIELEQAGIVPMPGVAMPVPHITWLSGVFRTPAINDALNELACQQLTIETIICGWGMLASKPPAIHLTLTRNPAMHDLHLRLYESTHNGAPYINPYTIPQYWLPHITLALHPLDEAIQPVISRALQTLPIPMPLTIDHWGILVPGQDGVSHRQDFQSNA